MCAQAHMQLEQFAVAAQAVRPPQLVDVVGGREKELSMNPTESGGDTEGMPSSPAEWGDSRAGA